MKNLTLILILFFSISVKSQSLEKIKNQNVYFILLDKNDTLSKYGCGKKDENENCFYHFYKTTKEEFEFHFNYSTYPTFDDEYNDMNKSMMYRVKKSFIRKNRDIIITRSFMEKVGEKNMIDLLFRGNKYIFLINTSETNKGKILLRQVQFNYTAPE